MYAGGGDFTTGIDKAGGEGTAQFVEKAVKAMIEGRRKRKEGMQGA